MKKGISPLPLVSLSIISLLLLNAGCTAPAQKVSPSDMKVLRPGAKSVVVVHSRTGNTAAAGKQISEALRTDYFRIETPEGTADNYISWPGRFEEVTLNPPRIDIGRYSLVFLGSPIWFWHADAFIYNFIKKHDLKGKRIVLFYTYEGGISKKAVGEWKDLVSASGGIVIDVVGINRKVHKTDDAQQAELKSIIMKKKAAWLNGK